MREDDGRGVSIGLAPCRSNAAGPSDLFFFFPRRSSAHMRTRIFSLIVNIRMADRSATGDDVGGVARVTRWWDVRLCIPAYFYQRCGSKRQDVGCCGIFYILCERRVGVPILFFAIARVPPGVALSFSRFVLCVGLSVSWVRVGVFYSGVWFRFWFSVDVSGVVWCIIFVFPCGLRARWCTPSVGRGLSIDW